MRIKKTSQTTPVQAEVVNDYSTSQENAYSCDYVNKALVENYSTDEVKTNKVWIDGKSIYRKVITGNYNDNAVILSNIGTLINVSGTGDSGTGITRLLPYYEIYNNQSFVCTLTKQSNNIVFISKLEGNSHIGSLNIIIEYTKTS